MAEKVEFSSKQMLDWMGYIADMLQISPEKIKLLNTDYVNVITPESLKGGQVENSLWSSNFVETVNKLID